ncbi:hypothetical protein COCSADRAFT_243882 [Bipolaris sorokiniana ND90Pr]|uniref:Uncharacterized protein n=1 Tax=Cochliobolus sativus (strain ND90Pr / ATCC 201652) TaxID=665912 RepID=M2QZM4_COCSN|nr:uncharacterized protein COCSADRAFT_243882 [Bipolaris sorokiniana ND90Pr]EMD60524.1 hypothetical protein COCSADRAFT_243882 [Bipolaris sorokiniana ND90Pr]
MAQPLRYAAPTPPIVLVAASASMATVNITLLAKSKSNQLNDDAKKGLADRVHRARQCQRGSVARAPSTDPKSDADTDACPSSQDLGAPSYSRVSLVGESGVHGKK